MVKVSTPRAIDVLLHTLTHGSIKFGKSDAAVDSRFRTGNHSYTGSGESRDISILPSPFMHGKLAPTASVYGPEGSVTG